jgi:hypothetical protein
MGNTHDFPFNQSSDSNTSHPIRVSRQVLLWDTVSATLPELVTDKCAALVPCHALPWWLVVTSLAIPCFIQMLGQGKWQMQFERDVGRKPDIP